MMHKAKFAVCSDIRTKHSTQSERHIEFLNVKDEAQTALFKDPVRTAQ